jgi:hypothetical protein
MKIFYLGAYGHAIMVVAENREKAFQMMKEADTERIRMEYVPGATITEIPIASCRPQDLEELSIDVARVICCKRTYS